MRDSGVDGSVSGAPTSTTEPLPKAVPWFPTCSTCWGLGKLSQTMSMVLFHIEIEGYVARFEATDAI